ncbi:MAG: peptidoglycan binding protein CsiV, partial [Amphritea sp.]|nr:peptidoglycan binding protein CsiV [Amphritea sp.]
PDAYYVDYGDATFSMSDLYSDKHLSQHHLLPLPTEDQSLNSAVRRLERDRTVEVIQHRAWLQAFPEEGDQRSVVGANLQLAKGRNLEGAVTIRKSRYMHIDADFSVSQSVAFYAVNWFDWATQGGDISPQILLTPVRAQLPERYSDSPIYASALTVESEDPLGLSGEASGDVNE